MLSVIIPYSDTLSQEIMINKDMNWSRHMSYEAHITTQTIGSQIKKHREQLGLSKVQLARLLGHKSSKIVNRWENDEVIPNHKSRQKLSAALKVNLNSESGVFTEIILPVDIEQNQRLMEIHKGLSKLSESNFSELYLFYEFLIHHKTTSG